MKDTLEEIRTKLKEGVYSNEEHIRFSLVGRILHKLGWNIWNPKEVYTEFPVARMEDNTKVDIALFLRANFPSVFIEIKGHTKLEQNLQSIEKQLRDYNRNNTATFTIITDGQHWRFYYSQTQGEFSDKCYRIIDLLKDDSQQLEDEFILLLSKGKIENGEAKNVAEKYLELSTKQRAIKDSIIEANKMILRNPLLNLVQALQDCVKEKGYSVEVNEVLEFLKNNDTSGTISNNLSQKPIPLATEKKVQSIKAPLEQNKNKNTTLKVSVNGHEFYDPKAIKVFTEVVEFFDIERVRELNLGSSKFPLIITKNQLGKYEKHKYTTVKNGYCILTHSSTLTKKSILDDIAKRLREKAKIEIVY